MNRLLALFITFFFLNNCSFNENSRIWKDKEKDLSEKENVKKIFAEKDVKAFTSFSANIFFTFSFSDKSFSLSFQILEFSLKEQLFRKKNVINNANSLFTQISV